MADSEPIFQLLYVSQMAPGSDFVVVNEIVGAARQRNPQRGIGGALVFDGERFGQLIEGAEAEATALMHSIARDPRHSDVRLLAAAHSTGGRTSHQWVSGYCEAGELACLAGDAGPRDQAAIDIFLNLLKSADVE